MSYSKFIKIIKFASSQKIRQHCNSRLSCQRSSPKLLRVCLWFRTLIHFVALAFPQHKIKIVSHSKNRTHRNKKSKLLPVEQAYSIYNEFGVLILSLFLHMRDFNRLNKFLLQQVYSRLPTYVLVPARLFE